MDINVAQLFQTVKLATIMPEVILSVFGMVLLLVNVFLPGRSKSYLAWTSLVGLIAAGYYAVAGWGITVEDSFNGSVVMDNFAIFFKILFLLVAALTILISNQYLEREGCNHGEYYPLILFSTVGMMLMAAGTDMMTIFLGLELMSITLYVLAGFNRDNVKSNESGLKYFLLGAFSTGFLLYGMALVYGATGTTNIGKISTIAAQMTGPNAMFFIGMLLILTGFAFKIAAAPFHMWTPDVYEGAPAPVTAFMSAGPKAAGFAAFLRVFIIAFPTMKADWTDILWVLAVLTMTIGNLTALRQDNIKRMLAYSSIAHAGYALVGFVAANATGISGILFYLLSYSFMNIGAFAVIILLGKQGEANGNVQDFAGLGHKKPLVAALMSLFLFSLAGMPPTAGFIGKFYLFSAALEQGYLWLAIIGVINSAASVYYYLRVMVFMYMKPAEEEFGWATLTLPVSIALLISGLGTLVPGIVPSVLLQITQLAIR